MSSAPAYAKDRGSKDFQKQIAVYRQFCQDGDCRAPFKNESEFDIEHPQQSHLSVEALEQLNKIASDQAQIWGDTILEGDYYAAGKTQLDYVLSIYDGLQLIGYKITYSERAWYTGACEFNGEEADLKGCQEGRIYESSYVSSDFKAFFHDEENYAEFTD